MASVLRIKNEQGEWEDITSIKGADGKDGKDGADGRDGRDGKDGKDGKDGAIQYTAGKNISIANNSISTSALNSSEVQNLIDLSIAELGQLGFTPTVVEQLPVTDIDVHTIYLVPKQGDTNDNYDEYVYVNNNWEHIGSTAIDLSNYYTKSETQEIVENRTPQIFEIKLANGFLESSVKSKDFSLFLPLAKYLYEKCRGNNKFIQAPLVYIYSKLDLGGSYDRFNYQLFFIDETFTSNNASFVFTLYNIPRSNSYVQQNYIAYTITSTLSENTISAISYISSSRNTYSIDTLGDEQTITAKKTFNRLPESSVVPTTNNQFTNKKYVDDTVASMGGGGDSVKLLNIDGYNSSNNALVLSTLDVGVYLLSNVSSTNTSFYFKARTSATRGDNINNIDNKQRVYLVISQKIPETYSSAISFNIYRFSSIIDRYTYTDYGTELNYQYTKVSESVLLTGSQTITGTKTFSTLPQSSATPTSNNQLVNKKYVDGKIWTGTQAEYDALSAHSENTIYFIKDDTNGS